MRVDLHTHSDRSDGTLSPARLVAHASAAGLDVLALTDHDTTCGWDEAAAAATDHGLMLLRGLEVSCRHERVGVHLLAYLPDPTHPGLAAELGRILAGRNDRLPALLECLRRVGVDIDVEDVRAVAGGAAATGRPHVADALVRLGVVADRDEAFRRFLGPGGPAYLDRYAADLVTMIGLVADAGGVSVLAHPWARRDDHGLLGAEGLAALRQQGLAGVEVDHQDHDPTQRARLRGLARELGLVVTGSSDFHGTGKVGHELACNTTDPGELDRLLDLASAAAAASDRVPPGVVR